jgi:hypothetical protein
MPGNMEEVMIEKLVKMPEGLGKSPKEPVMTIKEQMRGMLWEAFPVRPEDNRKSWFTWVSRSLGWKRRRVVAMFRCEARIVTIQEWNQLKEFQQRTLARRETLNDLAIRTEDLRRGRPGAE